MRRLIILALAGFAAQLVDGSLGMAYGVTSTTLLLASGLTPALASASVHLSEVGTTLAAGLSHWRMGNVNWRAVGLMALPGSIGAFSGAYLLTRVPAEGARLYVALFLILLGGYVLVRFSFYRERPVQMTPLRWQFLSSLGFVAGFLDASGGGGWGPVATPVLLSSNRLTPRQVIGTVDSTELAIAASASAGFLLGLPEHSVAWPIVIALLIGGVVAAPLAAWLVRWMHPRLLGCAVGGVILLTNARTVLLALNVDRDMRLLVYAAIVIVWSLALARAVSAVAVRRTRTRPTAN